MHYFVRVGLLAAALCWAGTSLAQESGSVDAAAPGDSDAAVTSYDTAFFDALGATSALDMVRQVPGFAFQDVEESRGYEGVGGNVLIDGRRPSTKTMALRNVLQRIDASQIERLDVIRGSTPEIDMQGQPVVVNLVRIGGVSETNALVAATKFYTDGDAAIISRLEKSRRTESYFFEGSLEARRERDENDAGEGPFRLEDAGGNLLRGGTYEDDKWVKRFQVVGNIEKETGNGLLRANASAVHGRNDEKESFALTDSLGADSRDLINTESELNRFELGIDYDGDLGDGLSYQIVALQSLSSDDDNSVRQSGDELQVSIQEEKAGESILRGLLSRRFSPRLTLEGGAEGAFNFLESDARLTENGEVIVLPAADIRVEETRGGLFTTLTLQPADSTSIELGLRGESSTITVTGDADAENDFSFVKPRLVASYSAESRAQYRLRIEREVGQLEFQDFAAGSELADQTVSAGNPDLRPEWSWVYEAAYEQPIFGDGAIGFIYRHFELEDVVDLIPVEGFAAPGNIGAGTRDEIGLSLSVPLESVGPGLGRVQLGVTWRDSEVTDPVTGNKREISGEAPFDGTLLYARDFPQLNGGFGARIEFASKETSYRLDEIIKERSEHYWRIYWDWRAKPSVHIRTMIENTTSRDLWRKRIRYDGLRSDGVIESREYRSAVFDPMLVVRVRWTF